MSEGLKPCPFCGSEARLLRGGTEVVCSSDGETGCNAVYFAVSDWSRRPVEDALRARAEAAEARAAQAEADARLMLAERYYADECGIFDDRLPLGDRTAVSSMARAYVSTPQAAWVEAVRRILATAGST